MTAFVDMEKAAIEYAWSELDYAKGSGAPLITLEASSLEIILRALAGATPDSLRYRALRGRDPGPDGQLPPDGPFIGLVPENLILTAGDADDAVDAFLARKGANQ